jgi:hypothetical protein
MVPLVMTISNPSHTFHSPGSNAVSQSIQSGFGSFFSAIALAFGGAFLGSASLTALNCLSFTQQWKASEVFLFTPVKGPWALQKGAMVAVNTLLVVPLTLILLVFGLATHAGSDLIMVLPGLLLVPVYGRIPALLQGSIPLSRATEEAKAVGRGCLTMLTPFFGLAVAGIALACRGFGFLPYMLLTEVAGVVIFCLLAKRPLKDRPWPLEA